MNDDSNDFTREERDLILQLLGEEFDRLRRALQTERRFQPEPGETPVTRWLKRQIAVAADAGDKFFRQDRRRTEQRLRSLVEPKP